MNLAVLVLLCAITIGCSHNAFLIRMRPSVSNTFAASTLTPGVVKFISLGHGQLFADVYWLMFIQYVGETDFSKTNSLIAYDYLDLITLLDSKFIQPYWFGAFTVGSDLRRPDLAKKLIDRGIQANQNNWYLPYIAGINQYLFAHNEIEAAKYYRMAAKFPDAPKWLGRQAQILEAKIPSQIKEINTWDTIYRTSDDPLVKQRAREHLATSWMKVFKLSPSEEIRKRARSALSELGVEVR